VPAPIKTWFCAPEVKNSVEPDPFEASKIAPVAPTAAGRVIVYGDEIVAGTLMDTEPELVPVMERGVPINSNWFAVTDTLPSALPPVPTVKAILPDVAVPATFPVEIVTLPEPGDAVLPAVDPDAINTVPD
jgi:hypothetical protein